MSFTIQYMCCSEGRLAHHLVFPFVTADHTWAEVLRNVLIDRDSEKVFKKKSLEFSISFVLAFVIIQQFMTVNNYKNILLTIHSMVDYFLLLLGPQYHCCSNIWRRDELNKYPTKTQSCSRNADKVSWFVNIIVEAYNSPYCTCYLPLLQMAKIRLNILHMFIRKQTQCRNSCLSLLL